MLIVDSTEGIPGVCAKDKDANHVVDMMRIPGYYYGVGIMYNFCKDSDPLLVLYLLRYD